MTIIPGRLIEAFQKDAMEEETRMIRRDNQGPDAASHADELPVRKVPNVPSAAEAYYGPDNYHVIAQMDHPAAQRPTKGHGGAFVHVFTDDGASVWQINDCGQDGCSYFLPDGKEIVWTSTRDNLELPIGDWSDQEKYPAGADLYISDLAGNNVRRLTENKVYDAEVSASPDGQWLVFGRSIDGSMNLWKMRPDGTEEQQITFAEDWQPGAPFYLPDSQTILFRASRRSEHKKVRPTPMTIFTIRHDGCNLVQRTFDRSMNWAPYPAPDGRHYVFVRVIESGNFEVFLGDLAGGNARRLTFHKGFDGFPSLSPDGRKMLFARSIGPQGLAIHVMDVSALAIGPEGFHGVPDETPIPAGGSIVNDF